VNKSATKLQLDEFLSFVLYSVHMMMKLSSYNNTHNVHGESAKRNVNESNVAIVDGLHTCEKRQK